MFVAAYRIGWPRNPDAGAIRIDGIDIRDVTLDSLRHSIGIVFQKSALLHRSIAENIRIGRLDASDEELMQAARSVESHEFIMSQPRGCVTLVGERGSSLSGGERQRAARPLRTHEGANDIRHRSPAVDDTQGGPHSDL